MNRIRLLPIHQSDSVVISIQLPKTSASDLFILPLSLQKLLKNLDRQPLILVYSHEQSERLFYTLDFIFGRVLNVPWAITSDKDDFINHMGMKLSYSNDYALRPNVQPCGFLHEKVIRKIKPDLMLHKSENEFAFFFTSDDSFLGFDLFALCFYFISRYEEYTFVSSGDDHLDRFSYSDSFIHSKVSPTKPLVDIWIWKFWSKLKAHFPEININSSPQVNFLSTIDIDRAWAFAHRGLIDLVGGSVKDLIKLDFTGLKNRINANIHPDNDPFFTFDYLRQVHIKNNVKPLFFILSASVRDTIDENVSLQHPAMIKLITALCEEFDVGLHPSIQSHTHIDILTAEKSALERLTGRPISKSRQHYLKLNFPQTYRNLISVGMRDDFSMGYHDKVGFRAGTAHLYHWYDIEYDKITPLMIHPVTLMDMSLKKYQSSNPASAFDTAKDLIDQIKSTGGQFQLLWHNSSFYNSNGWEGWKELYESILAEKI